MADVDSALAGLRVLGRGGAVWHIANPARPGWTMCGHLIAPDGPTPAGDCRRCARIIAAKKAAERIDEIQITRVYEVVCDDHGVIGSARTHATAVEFRRAHFDADHSEADRG